MRTLSFLRDGHIVNFHVFPFFAVFFPPYNKIYCALPPLLSVSAPQNTPFLGFGVFPSHAYIYIYITDSVSLHGDAFSLLETRTGFLHSFFPSRCGWPSVAGESLLPLGYLLLFLTVCPHKQNGGLLFLLLWYGGRVGGTATLGVKGRRERREEEGRFVFGGVRECPDTGSVILRVSIGFNLYKSVAPCFSSSHKQ